MPGNWLDDTILQAQHVIERLAIADRDQAWDVLRDFAAGLPRAVDPSDGVLLRTTLMDVAYRGGDLLHRRLHGGDAHCTFSPASLLDRFWIPNHDVVQQFEQWRVAFFDEMNRVHPPSLASAIGRLVKRDFSKPWTLSGLGRRFHATSSQVSRAFSREFGSSVREYHRVARLVAALDILRNEKVDVVASQVGFKSKKNFYRAFVRLIGLTPSKFKQLPGDRASHIRTAAELRLTRRRNRSRHSRKREGDPNR